MAGPQLPPLADASSLTALTGGDEGVAEAAVRRASARFRSQTGQPITHVVGDRVVLDGGGSTVLLLPHVPVTDVRWVRVLGVPVLDPQWSSTGVLLAPDELGGRWPDRLRAVEVVYDHGHVTVPDDVEEAVLEQAAAALSLQALTEATGVVPGMSLTVGGVATSLAAGSTGVSELWSSTIARYRLDGADRA